MKEITPYLNFDGNCREAMTFYGKVFGVEPQLLTFAEGPCNVAPEDKGRIMHARLTKGNVLLMASDAVPGMCAFQPGNNFSMNIDCESMEEIEGLFGALGEKGSVIMPLADMFWGAHWGMLTDQFGVRWMFNFEKAKQSVSGAA